MVKKLLSSFYLHLFILALAGLALLVFFSSRFGPGVETDSVNYISVAENLAAGSGFVNFNGGIYVLWPPLHPILLSIPRFLLDIDPVSTAAVINGLSFAAAIFLAGVVMYAYTEKKLWGYLGALIVLSSASLMGLALNLGTDPLFVVMVLLFMLSILRYYRRTDTFSFVAMTLIAILACLLRYVGVILVVTGVFAIILAHRNNWIKGLGLATLFGVLTLAPLGLWFSRNILETGSLVGTRNPSAWNLSENAADAVRKLSRWFLPYLLTTNPIFLLLFGGAIGFFLGSRPAETRDRLKAAYLRPASLLMLILVAVYIAAGLVLIKSEDHRLLYDDRYFVPIIIPLFYFVFVFIDATVLPLLSRRGERLGTAILVALFAAWLLFPAYTMAKFGRQLMSAGGVPYYNLYNLPRFRDSDITQNLEATLGEENLRVYSNYSAAVYLYTRLETLGPPVRQDFFGDPLPLGSYESSWPESTPAVLIWYEPNHKKHLFFPEDLQNIAGLDTLYQSEGGAIYSIRDPSQVSE